MVLAIVIAAGLVREPAVAPTETPAAPPRVAAPEGTVNRPPIVARITLSPEAPDRLAVLTAQVETSDPEQDSVFLDLHWLVDDRETGITGPSFSLADVKPGQRVALRVVAADAAGQGETRTSDPVTVVDRPPVIRSIRFAPEVPAPGAPLAAVVEAEDPEGDPVTFEYRWRVGDQPIDGIDAARLAGRHVTAGAHILVMVTPRDPYLPGETSTSPVVIAANLPPTITSSPPERPDGAVYRYQAVATDPDGDALTFVLESGPPGMTIDPASGRLEWSVPASVAAPFPVLVRLRADDGKGGRAIQQFTVQVQ